MYFGDVLYDPASPDPEAVFKMVVFDMPEIAGVKYGEGRPGVPGMVTATSADGVHLIASQIRAQGCWCCA